MLPLGDRVWECANDRCTERLHVSMSDYERVRADGATFFVLPNQLHVDQQPKMWRLGENSLAATRESSSSPRSTTTTSAPSPTS